MKTKREQTAGLDEMTGISEDRAGVIAQELEHALKTKTSMLSVYTDVISSYSGNERDYAHIIFGRAVQRNQLAFVLDELRGV